MSNRECEFELRGVADCVAGMAREVPLNSAHRTRLRIELLRRHAELATYTEAPPRRLSRLPFGRRGGVVVAAPAALAMGVVASVLFWLMPIISGHQSLQAVEAARVTQALARTAPTVTEWRWTLRETVDGRTTTAPWQYGFSPYQRLYVRYGQCYLYSDGHWYLAPSAPLDARRLQASAWGWVFANLPRRLARHRFVLLPDRLVDGHAVEGFRFSLPSGQNVSVVATAWVDRRSGLIVRLERQLVGGEKVIEQDVADYSYRTAR